MVLNYYNLSQQPFGVAPDPRFLLMTRTHREALASLMYGLQEERGFMALAAPPGMGKTTLLFRLLENLRNQRARTVFLFQTQCDPGDFFRYLVRDMGLTPGPDLASIHEQLNQALLDEARAGGRFVLIVDEAQGLHPSVLETIRLLSDFETPGRKLLQIILAGQLGLVETLMRRDMEQLRQRISIVTSLQPFTQEEVAEYVAHRLSVAGHPGTLLFTEEALQLIALRSKGIPRNINNICFNALSAGYALRKKYIGREVIDEVLTDLKIESLVEKGCVETSPSGPKSSLAVRAWLSARSYLSRKKNLIAGTALTAAFAATTLGLNWASVVGSLRSRAATIPSSVIPQDEATAAQSPAPSPLSAPDGELTKQSDSRVVVVTPGQTLSEISARYLGEYSPAALAKLQALNPSLTSPDLIRAGGQIRLPVSTAGVEGTNAVGADGVRH